MYIVLIIIFATIATKLLYKELKFRQERHKNPVPASPKGGPFFDSRLRKKLQPTELILKRSGITKGMTVLDLGCGSGAYTTDTARAVGKNGLVYAVDLQDEMLAQLKAKLQKEEFHNLNNIKIVKANASKLPFKPNTFDLVYLIDVLQEIPNSLKALIEIKRVLKPNGILAITEYFMDPDFAFKSAAVKLCEKAGFIKQNIQGWFFFYTARFTRS